MNWLKSHVSRGEVYAIVMTLSAFTISVCLIAVVITRPTTPEEAVAQMNESLKTAQSLQQKMEQSEIRIGQHADKITKSIEELKTVVINQTNNIDVRQSDPEEDLIREMLIHRGKLPKENK